MFSSFSLHCSIHVVPVGLCTCVLGQLYALSCQAFYDSCCGHILCYTVDSPNKGRVGTVFVSFVRRLPSLGDSKCIGTIGKNAYLGTSAVSFVERLSLFRSVHYQRFPVYVHMYCDHTYMYYNIIHTYTYILYVTMKYNTCTVHHTVCMCTHTHLADLS